MVAGAGGINSWFLHHINRLIRKDQIPSFASFTIFDGDDVEQKNLLYQDFELVNVLENKAKTLGDRYDMIAKGKYIKNPKDFDPYDIVVCGVDNKKFREMLFRYMATQPDKYWIDMRSEGRAVTIYTKNKKNTLEYMLSTLPKNDVADASCQLEYELSSGIIQLGNQISSIIGAQYLLNFIRGEESPDHFIYLF